MTLPDTFAGRQPVIFSDFDGTITQRDVIQMIMEAFAPPVWREIVDQILVQRTLSIHDGVIQLFHLIPGTLKEDIIAFVHREVRLRDGFPEFLDFCQAHDIPFYVVSGGVDFFIEPVLAPFRHQLTLYCNKAIFHPDRIDLEMPHYKADCTPCNQCACCKLGVVARHRTPQSVTIGIGDSLTDLALSKGVDWAFARGKLIDYAGQDDVPVTPFETFRDIQAQLAQKMWVAQP